MAKHTIVQTGKDPDDPESFTIRNAPKAASTAKSSAKAEPVPEEAEPPAEEAEPDSEKDE